MRAVSDTCAGPEAVVAEAAPVTEELGGDRPVLKAVAGTGPARSDLYYRSATRPQAAPASVSP